MIKHIVAFKLKDAATAPIVQAELATLANLLEGMRHWEVGVNIGSSSQPYELVVYSVFDSLERLAAFRVHPQHEAVKKAIASYIETSGTIDYQVDEEGRDA